MDIPNTGTKHIVEIFDYSDDGAGIARLDNGCIVFAPNAVRGDICSIVITKVLSNVCYANIEKILTPSKHRITVDCPVFYECGGCQYRHISYEEELYAKRKKVNDALCRIGGLGAECNDVLTTGTLGGYRNKSQFKIANNNGKIVTGFYRPGSHEVVEIESCPIMTESTNNAVRCVREWLLRYNISVYDEKSGTGLARHIYTREGQSGLMVCLVINGKKIPYSNELIDALKKNCESLSSLMLNINRNRNEVILGHEFITLWGCDYIDDTLGDLSFRLSPESFYQVNTAGALMLYEKAREYAALSDDEFLIDLYCGTGTITLFLGRDAKTALGVENVATAVNNAKQNAIKNNIQNVKFLCSDVSKLDTDGLKPDCVIIDPPRKGVSVEVIKKLEGLAPSRIIYISCNPATLARDIKRIKHYKVDQVCAVDMFPRTKHVECVVLMSRLKSAT